MTDAQRGRSFMAGLEKPDVANARLAEWYRQIGVRLREIEKETPCP